MAMKRLNEINSIDIGDKTIIRSHTPTEPFEITVNNFEFDNEAESCNVEIRISNLSDRQLKSYINAGRSVYIELFVKSAAWCFPNYSYHKNYHKRSRDIKPGNDNDKKRYARYIPVYTEYVYVDDNDNEIYEEFERFSKQIQLVTPENQTIKFSIPYSYMNIGKHVFVEENWEYRNIDYRFYLHFSDWVTTDTKEAQMPPFPDARTNNIRVSYVYGDDPVPGTDEEPEEAEGE